ncbi:MAG: heme o synthase [Candidatus Dormibacteraeota bacterium]|nr:heme o synthase [Candidatus Dormibacteraeota bacterium]
MSAVGTVAVPAPNLRQQVRDYIALTKPRVISLLLVTALASMVTAQRGWPATDLVLAIMVGGYLAAGGANAINMWFDRDIDAQMYRTRQRPIPAGRVPARNALVFGIVLNLLAFLVIAGRANLLAAALTLAATLFYVLVYTMALKRSTPQNIVIGGAAGAFPPLIGWSAVTGNLDMTALYLFAIVFFWTPPHFWALALRLEGDYGRANVPMLPQVHGRTETARQMLLYSVVLVAVSMLLGFRGFGLAYFLGAAVLGGGLVAMCIATLREEGNRWARRTFTYSLLYLALLFASMVLDALLRAPSAN